MSHHARNPALAIFANPGRSRRWQRIGTDVQAIAYIHAKDGQPYVHAFGGVEPTAAELRAGRLDLDRLATETGVEMLFSPDHRTVMIRHRDGLPLIRMF
jgi:hypothetical protein